MTNAAALRAADTVIRRCREIAACTEVPGQTSRPFLCPSARQVHTLLSSWMSAAGLSVWVDNAGNLRGLYQGLRERAPRLLIGSHLDTVPNAGPFDGILGVLLGLAVIEQLQGKRLPFAIEIVGFSEEEGVRFGRPFLGSLAFTGQLQQPDLALRDRAGLTVSAALQDFDLDPSQLQSTLADDLAFAFVEVHIEQGPVLESLGTPLAVVDSIVGQTRLLLTFRGRSNHAGTTPMQLRHDPVAAAGEWIVALEAHAQAVSRLVATVGRLETSPGVANIIAGQVIASLDLRHPVDAVRLAAVQFLTAAAHDASRRRGVDVSIETTLDQPAVPMAPHLTAILAAAARRAGYTANPIGSGAGHDAMIVAARMPAAMFFVRSPGGISHHPDETVLPQDVAAALETMMEFLELLRHDERGGKPLAHHG